jgi:hypothetical protein
MLRIVIAVVVLFVASTNVLGYNENGKTALKRLLRENERAVGLLEDLSDIKSEINEEISLRPDEEKENMDPLTDLQSNEIKSSDEGKVIKSSDSTEEIGEDDEDDLDADDENNSESVSIEDGWDEFVSTESAMEKSERRENEFANEDTVERSLEDSLAELNAMIQKANPELTEVCLILSLLCCIFI